LLISWMKPARAERQIVALSRLPERPKRYGSLVVLFGLVFTAGLYLITLYPEISEPFTAAVMTRLLPVILLLTGLSLQSLLALLLLRGGLTGRGIFNGNGVFWLSIALFSLCILLWGWVVNNTLQSETAITGWNDLGAPILETQVILAWLAGLATWGIVLAGSHSARLSLKILDLILALALWVGTMVLWNATPAPPSYFLSLPRAPNLEPYPNSDAILYDMSAQVMMIGEGLRFNNDIYVRRPLLSVFISGLHAFGGQSPAGVAFWQIAVLAWIPAFVYLLGKSLHSRPSGVIAGTLIMLRGAMAIAVSDIVTTSHAKLLMADLPSMLVMTIFVFISVRWLQNRSQILGLASGGLLGAAILIRPELGAAALPAGLISWLVFRKQPRQWLTNILLFVLGISLLLAPWVYRNWSLTGLVFLDSPTFRTDWLEERYRSTPPTSQPPPTPAPTQPQTYHPQLEGVPTLLKTGYRSIGSALPAQTPAPPERAGDLITNIQDNSARVARFVLSHYLNSQLQLFFTLPTTFRPLDSLAAFIGHRSLDRLWQTCCSAENYVRRLPYWHRWDGRIPSQAFVWLALNLLLVALGIQQAWKKERWIGLFPLAVSLTHLLLNALARNSGGRYILPVDWIFILYFSFGLAQASLWVFNLFRNEPLRLDPRQAEAAARRTKPSAEVKLLRQPQFYLLAALLFLVGCAAPVLEKAYPQRYPAVIQEQMLASFMASAELSAQDQAELTKLIEGNGLVSVGRALYPRFYKADQGEPGSPDPLGPQTYPRLGFYLAGQTYKPVILPLNHAPGWFPNASDALVIACPDGQAAAVAIFTSPQADPLAVLLRSEEGPPLSCLISN